MFRSSDVMTVGLGAFSFDALWLRHELGEGAKKELGAEANCLANGPRL